MDFKDYQKGVDSSHFWFKAKRDHMRHLMYAASLPAHAKILCVGAGTGEDLEILRSFGVLYAIDIDSNALALIPDSYVAEKKYADVCQLPYADNFFDCVIACDVLEHVERDDFAVAEIIRVLKPGGAFVLTVPANNAIFGAHDKALGHHRRYNKPQLCALMKDMHKKKQGYWFFSGFLPIACMRYCTRNCVGSGMVAVPRLLNTILYTVMRGENWLLRHGIQFPWGLSLYGIYTKKH